MSSGILDFFNKGSDEAAGRGDDVLRVRLECLVQFIYYLVLALILFKQSVMAHAVVLCVVTLIQVLLFINTYRSKSRTTRMVFIACMGLTAAYLSAVMGMTSGFQYFMYVALILLLLETHITFDSKIFLCTGIILVSVILNAVALLNSFNYPLIPGSAIEARVRVLNELSLAFNIVILGMSYTRHQVEAERQLYLANQKLKLAADTDPLTRLPNRRAILDVLEEIDRDKDSTISIAIGDIDHFKRVNDTYGHDAGDEVLKNISELIMKFMDKKGYCARWGGEEFLLVFTDTNGDDAYMVLDNFRRRLSESVTEYEGTRIMVTMTFGLEEHGFFQTTDKTIKAADSKLYTGKDTGRNKVVY